MSVFGNHTASPPVFAHTVPLAMYRSRSHPFSVLPLLGVSFGLALAMPSAILHAQAPDHPGEIEGVVRDAASGEPLAGATVFLVGTRQIAVSHGDGTFHLTGIAPGVYTLRVERLGYRSATTEVTVGDATPVVEVDLDFSPVNLTGLVVSGAVTQRASNESLRPVNVLNSRELQTRLQGTVAATLTAEPGVSMTSMGPATARPVIRGMSGDRVLMLEDGARVGDVSNSGSDHATAVDPSSARRLEVVRGPAALLYGSNALGGVVNVIRDEVPTSVPHHATGAATLQTQTVNATLAASGHTQLPLTDNVPLRLEATGRTASDLTTPIGTLQNTGVDMWSAGVGSAYVSDWGHLGGAFRVYQNDYGIPGGFVGGHADGVRVEMERTSTKLRASIEQPIGPFQSIDIDGTYTWYRHKEIEPPDILGTFFKRQTLTGDALGRHGEWGPFSGGAMGVRTSWEAFTFAGGLSTPDSRRYTAAAYVFEEIDLDPIRLEAGLRYDWVQASPLQDDPSSDIGNIRQRSFSAASASLGALYDLGSGWSTGATVARAFRTPDINELYSEGPHLAAYSFEVGNPSLGTEVGTGVDLFLRLTRESVNAEVTGFHNDIAGYVYGEETGNLSPTLLPIYQFQENDAVLQGFESSVDWNVTGGVSVGATASYVRGTLSDTDEPLPLIPPLQGRFSVGYDTPGWFVHGETAWAARQDRLGEFETVTDGYTVFNLSGGAQITLGGRLNVLTLSLENLTDVEYRNHLSRIKEIMPEAGRGLSLTYRVVF